LYIDYDFVLVSKRLEFLNKIKKIVETHHYNNQYKGIAALTDEYMENIEHYKYFYKWFFHIRNDKDVLGWYIRMWYTHEEIDTHKEVISEPLRSKQTWWQKFMRFLDASGDD
jgi:hypothetical protein